MADSLELKRLKLEVRRVDAAQAEQEFKIEEALDNIERLRENIKNQEARKAELAVKIAEMEAKRS